MTGRLLTAGAIQAARQQGQDRALVGISEREWYKKVPGKLQLTGNHASNSGRYNCIAFPL